MNPPPPPEAEVDLYAKWSAVADASVWLYCTKCFWGVRIDVDLKAKPENTSASRARKMFAAHYAEAHQEEKE